MAPPHVRPDFTNGGRPHADDRSYGQSLLAGCPEETSPLASRLRLRDDSSGRRWGAVHCSAQRLKIELARFSALVSAQASRGVILSTAQERFV